MLVSEERVGRGGCGCVLFDQFQRRPRLLIIIITRHNMDSLVTIFTVLAATIFIISAVIVYCVILIKNKKNKSENGYKHHQVDDISVNLYFSKQQESRIESISGRKFVPKRPEDAQSRKQDFGTPSKCGKYDHFYITFHSAKTPLMSVDQSMTKYKTFHQEFYD